MRTRTHDLFLVGLLPFVYSLFFPKKKKTATAFFPIVFSFFFERVCVPWSFAVAAHAPIARYDLSFGKFFGCTLSPICPLSSFPLLCVFLMKRTRAFTTSGNTRAHTVYLLFSLEKKRAHTNDPMQRAGPAGRKKEGSLEEKKKVSKSFQATEAFLFLFFCA